MSQLNIFIDGSWLFKACAADRALSVQTETPEKPFELEFTRLTRALHEHARNALPECTALGEQHCGISILTPPDDFAKWPGRVPGVTPETVSTLRRRIAARASFASKASAAGYRSESVFHPPLREWMIDKLLTGQFQEKQVDTTLVALIVKAAVLRPEDVHVLVTGDVDLLPAVRIAFPPGSDRVFLATTPPDELQAERRQSSFTLNNFAFGLSTFYLSEHVCDIMAGKHTYRCAHCHRAFARAYPLAIKAGTRPCCKPCFVKRT